MQYDQKKGIICLTSILRKGKKYMTLLVLAAGLGSRYGGLKQIDPMTDHGEFIIDFSVFDAIRAGFDRVVFIIKKENYEVFHETIGSRIADRIKVEYAFQGMHDYVPDDKFPVDRVKPWGTFHAVLCAKELLNDSFAVINSDDFYGPEAYRKIACFLKEAEKNPGGHHYAMVGYLLGNTVVDAGSVARGVCTIENGYLKSIKETTKIFKDPAGGRYEDENGKTVILPGDTVVSMNFWGFTPDFLENANDVFDAFLNSDHPDPLKAECYLPTVVGDKVSAGECCVSVLTTNDKWYGVTYHEEKPEIMQHFREMISAGLYPDGLWK